jgi:hypothetical protein
LQFHNAGVLSRTNHSGVASKITKKQNEETTMYDAKYEAKQQENCSAIKILKTFNIAFPLI